MDLSPALYHRLIRPQWLTSRYITNMLRENFDFRNKRVLDFGSGIGACCCGFSPENYLGVDCDARRIAYAGKLFPRYRFRAIRGARLPVANDSVDYILIIAVLHHIPPEDLPPYLEEFRRVLKPDGQILVNEPCFFSGFGFRNRFMAIFDQGKYIRREDEYLQVFRAANFQTEVVKRYQKMFFYNELFFIASTRG